MRPLSTQPSNEARDEDHFTCCSTGLWDFCWAVPCLHECVCAGYQVALITGTQRLPQSHLPAIGRQPQARMEQTDAPFPELCSSHQ